jgi:type II secretory pathway component GspD/PulD (secretin)
MSETKPKRRWFSFSIRDLLLLTVIAALAVGWWLDHRKLTKDNSAQFTIFYLRYADAKVVGGTLQKLFAGNSDMEIAADGKLNAIIAHGPAKQLDAIELILKTLDVRPTPTAEQTVRK